MTPAKSEFDLNHPEIVSALDEVSIWCSMAGSLLLENVPLRRNIRALDIGCGVGFPILELAQRLGTDSQVAGIDPWQAAMARAARKAAALGIANIELVSGSADKMPWEDGRFDLIVSNLGINNFENPEKVLAEAYRVAKSGAVIALTSNLRGHMREFYEEFEKSLQEVGAEDFKQRLAANIEHRIMPERAVDLLAGAGFEVGRVIRRDVPMRYASGSAMLGHSFIRMAFLEAWRAVAGPIMERAVFQNLENRLNQRANDRGALVVTVPFVYIDAHKRTAAR